MSGHRLVVVDLEATCWTLDDDPALAANQRNESEVIEIGAVLLDPETFEERSSFQVFVRPTRHPVLSPFCTQLTSITQAQVEAAATLPDAWSRFVQWMDGDAGAELAAWGAYDAAQLRREARRHGLPTPRWSPHNVKAAFGKHLKRTRGPGRHRTGLQAALAGLGFTFEGTPHRALDDARNAARVLRFLRTWSPEDS